MKEVFSSPDGALMGFYESLLDEADIPYFVRNDAAQQTGAAGLVTPILPLPDFWPTLCVLNDDDHDRAKELIRAAREAPPITAEDWKCPACGETVPANFTSCWNCGADSPAPETGVAPSV